MGRILFLPADKKVALVKRSNIKHVIAEVFEIEKKSLKELTYIFCSDEYLLNINREYLKHNYYTDVITFSFSNKNEPIIGEAYLSVDRIKENAKAFNALYQTEVLRVMIHAVLHLCGYSDQTSKQKAVMRAKEDYYLNLSFT